MRQNLIPELTRACHKKNENFSGDSNKLNGGYPYAGNDMDDGGYVRTDIRIAAEHFH